MKKILVFAIFIFQVSFFAQKKTVYINGKDTIRLKLNENLTYNYSESLPALVYENVHEKFYRIINRLNEGKISEMVKKQITDLLENNLNKKIKDTLPLIIKFHHKNSNFFNDKDKNRIAEYLNKQESFVLKLSKVKPTIVNVFSSNSKLSKGFKKELVRNLVIDKNNYFENTFFPYDLKYGSFLFINPNNNFVIYYGEYPHRYFTFLINTKKSIKDIKNGRNLTWRNLKKESRYHKFLDE